MRERGVSNIDSGGKEPHGSSSAFNKKQFTQGSVLLRIARLHQTYQGLLYIVPAMSVLGIVLLFPLAYVTYISFFVSSAGCDLTFGGLANYVELLRGERFWNALLKTVIFTFGSVIFHMLLGVYAAHIANKQFRGRTALRLIALSPWTFPSVVVAVTWMWIYQSQFGVLNDLLLRMGFMSEPYSWLGSEATAF